jgi:ElaA protein
VARGVRFLARAFEDLTLMEFHDLVRLREEVFVVGQRITAEPEIDGLDPAALHVLGIDGQGRLVATARLLAQEDPVRVGRVAVHPAFQRQGVGTSLMEVVHALLGDRSATMSAQAHLVPWYERLGWTPRSEPYEEAGIPHRSLVRPGG